MADVRRGEVAGLTPDQALRRSTRQTDPRHPQVPRPPIPAGRALFCVALLAGDGGPVCLIYLLERWRAREGARGGVAVGDGHVLVHRPRGFDALVGGARGRHGGRVGPSRRDSQRSARFPWWSSGRGRRQGQRSAMRRLHVRTKFYGQWLALLVVLAAIVAACGDTEGALPTTTTSIGGVDTCQLDDQCASSVDRVGGERSRSRWSHDTRRPGLPSGERGTGNHAQ